MLLDLTSHDLEFLQELLGEALNRVVRTRDELRTVHDQHLVEPLLEDCEQLVQEYHRLATKFAAVKPAAPGSAIIPVQITRIPPGTEQLQLFEAVRLLLARGQFDVQSDVDEHCDDPNIPQPVVQAALACDFDLPAIIEEPDREPATT